MFTHSIQLFKTNASQIIKSAQNLHYGIDASGAFSQVMGYFQKGIYAYAAYLVIFGLIRIGQNWGEQGNTAETNKGFAQVIGGLIVGFAGTLITQITL